MDGNLGRVLASVLPVFGLIGLAWIYCRRARPQLSGMLQAATRILVPCLVFTAILDSAIAPRALAIAAAATVLQIGLGLGLGWLVLRLAGLGSRRGLLLPVSFVNASYLAFPLVLACYGKDGLSIGVISYAVMMFLLFTVGILLVHGGGRSGRAWREPAVWATVTATALKLLGVHPADAVMAIPRLAAPAAVPVMLILFGDTLSRTRLAAVRPAALAVLLRYATGAAGLAILLPVFHPTGLLRKVLILYALLPPAITNVVLAQKAERDAEAVASAVLLGTVVAVVLLPLLLAALH